ncbi:MAG TPA: TonB family protein [Alphaproteobacteria bacterium]|jgi:protein TonB|nr:TonB family protein [Alphaproteobacteria bacterium]
MVRAIDSCIWRNAPFLERVRPGLAISVVLHAALLVALAYFLAFHSPMPQPADPEPPSLTVVQPPVTPPPVKPIDSDFHPKKIEVLNGIRTSIQPITIKPFEAPPTKSAKSDTPQVQAEPTIIAAQPLYRGNLAYPARALDAGKSGFVDFVFTIEPDGSVGDLKMVQEVPAGYGFAAAAAKAFPSWKFQPKSVDGKPVATLARYRVTFQLK